MPIYGRVVMAALGGLMVWKIVNACFAGVITSRGMSFDINEQPMMFSFGLTVYAVSVLFCGWLAAGYDIPSFWHFVASR